MGQRAEASSQVGLGDVPPGFVEIRHPLFLSHDGRPMGAMQEPQDGDHIFVRGLLVSRERHPFIWHTELKRMASTSPRWTFYGGPFSREDESRIQREMHFWAFNFGTGFWWVELPSATIAPDGLMGRTWPRKEVQWTWTLEFTPTAAWRIRNPDPAMPLQSRQQWEKA